MAGLALAIFSCGCAWAQTPPAPADPKLDAARIAFEELSEADRRAIQDALVWTGDYSSTTTGAFGRRTYEGILAYQRRSKLPETGILDAANMRAVKTAGERAKAAAGFAILPDAATGMRLGLPQKLLPKRSPGPAGGTRFQSQDGRVTLDTREAPGAEAELKDLYERNLAIQTPGRKVTYKLSRPDFFVITGETATGRFYTRYAAGPGGLRGFSIGYDKAQAKDLERVVVAISNAFEPFPGTGPAAAGSSQGGGPAAAQAQVPTAAPVTAAFTGLAVGPRRVVTSAAIEGCADPQVGTGKARILKLDKAIGLAVLEPAAPLRAPAPRLAAADPGPQDGLAVVFLHAQEGRRAFATAAEPAGAQRLTAPLQPGAAGGVVTDRSGRVVGIVPSIAQAPRQIAGIVPPSAYAFVGTASLRALLGADAPAGAADGGGASRTIGAIASELAPSLLTVGCAAGTRAP